MTIKPTMGDCCDLFVNRYEDCAFSSCPRCDAKTKIRKFYLAIHVEPALVVVLNKRCRFCEKCELLIVNKVELESLMVHAVERERPELVGNQYSVFGSFSRADGQAIARSRDHGKAVPGAAIERVRPFRDSLLFEPNWRTWQPDSLKRPG